MNMNNTDEKHDDGSSFWIKYVLWGSACVIFPPIGAFLIGWFVVSGMIWLLRCFLGVAFTALHTDANVDYSGSGQSFSTNFYDPDRN